MKPSLVKDETTGGLYYPPADSKTTPPSTSEPVVFPGLAHLLLQQQNQMAAYQQGMIPEMNKQTSNKADEVGMAFGGEYFHMSHHGSYDYEKQQHPRAVSTAVNNIFTVNHQSKEHVGHLPQASSHCLPSSPALAALLEAGGNEALHHLVTLGLGTLMAAAELRRQNGGGTGTDTSAATLAAAQLHVAAQPSTQAILSSMLEAAEARRLCDQQGGEGEPSPAALPGGVEPPTANGLRGQSSSGNGSPGALCSSGSGEGDGLLLSGGGLLGTSLGSATDLLGLLSAPGAGSSYSPSSNLNRLIMPHVDSMSIMEDYL